MLRGRDERQIKALEDAIAEVESDFAPAVEDIIPRARPGFVASTHSKQYQYRIGNFGASCNSRPNLPNSARPSPKSNSSRMHWKIFCQATTRAGQAVLEKDNHDGFP